MPPRADAGRVIRREKEEFDVRWEHPAPCATEGTRREATRESEMVKGARRERGRREFNSGEFRDSERIGDSFRRR